ncbi:MAG: DUF3887 domain-containing protein [Lachnospiraceae bacterium]|nr:DUF3887 domain-containing protein [Lachnospiraceae bacterium]MDD3617134.1 DUF3887 domain-containing protein [Lachnospiraceae bacterium]
MREKKRNVRTIIRSALVLVVVFTLMGCSTPSTKLSDKFDEETVKSEAMRSVEYFNDRDYASIIEMGSEELKASITEAQFAEQCDPYLDKDGAFKEITKTVVMGSEDKTTGETYGGVVMIGSYENGKIQFTIGFDEEMKLVQFIIK